MNKLTFLFVKVIKSSYCIPFFRRFNQNARMSCLRHKNAFCEGIVTICKIKHKVTLKWCRPCEKYVLKKQYRMHIQTPLHREVVNDGEKHSSHKTKDDDFETEDKGGRNCVKLGAQSLHNCL